MIPTVGDVVLATGNKKKKLGRNNRNNDVIIFLMHIVCGKTVYSVYVINRGETTCIYVYNVVYGGVSSRRI